MIDLLFDGLFVAVMFLFSPLALVANLLELSKEDLTSSERRHSVRAAWFALPGTLGWVFVVAKCLGGQR
ncbi:MAG: hypothetical protein ACJ79R_22190 [Anaeromyxobacteraceae bacterium]